VIGQQPATDGGTVPVFAGINSSRLPVYHRLDLRMVYAMRFQSWTLSPFLELLNVYDRQNLATIVWSSSYSEDRRIKQLPRIVFFGLEFKF